MENNTICELQPSSRDVIVEIVETHQSIEFEIQNGEVKNVGETIRGQAQLSAKPEKTKETIVVINEDVLMNIETTTGLMNVTAMEVIVVSKLRGDTNLEIE